MSIRVVTNEKTGSDLEIMWVGMGPHAVLSSTPVRVTLADLPAWVAQSLAVLMVLPVPPPPQPYLQGFGSRFSEDTFWLDDKGGWL
jgi:hypothetical protein